MGEKITEGLLRNGQMPSRPQAAAGDGKNISSMPLTIQRSDDIGRGQAIAHDKDVFIRTDIGQCLTYRRIGNQAGMGRLGTQHRRKLGGRMCCRDDNQIG